jgi:hypothetical protein
LAGYVYRVTSQSALARLLPQNDSTILQREGSRDGSPPPAIFIADSPGLDFLNSIATPVDSVVDWIDHGDGLLNWLDQARLVPHDALQALRMQALPGELDKVADQARGLREWFRGFVRDHKGRPWMADDLRELQPLNRLLERDEAFSRSYSRHGSDSLAGVARRVRVDRMASTPNP